MKTNDTALKDWLKGDALKEWLAGGANWPERVATCIERNIPAGCKHESAIAALQHVAQIRKVSVGEGAMINIVHAVAHWKDYQLWDDAIRGESSGAGTSKGGFNSSKKKKATAVVWQIKIKPRVKKMLEAKRTDLDIAGRTYIEAGRSLETVRKFVAEERKAMLKK